MWAILVAFIWECAWFIKKKLHPRQIGDPNEPCLCGSATTQVEGRRTHYTPNEFDERFYKKYNRRGSKLRVLIESYVRLENRLREQEHLSEGDVAQYRSLHRALGAELDRLIAKYRKKWVQCIRCGATSRRSHMPIVNQVRLDFGIRGQTVRPNVLTHLFLTRLGEEE
jgi:hypothetical protein